MSKLDQIRALRESRFTPTPAPAVGDKIIFNGEERVVTATLSICPTCGQAIHKTGFDRKAYQREYMRKRRAQTPPEAR